MNKAFTLIELLGVIIILAVIALITTPVITTVLKNNKENADTTTVESIVTSAKNFAVAMEAEDAETEFYINYNNNPYTLTFKSGAISKDNKFKNYIYDNNIPSSGGVYICENGSIELKLWFEKESICIVKKIDNRKIYIDRDITNKSACDIDTSNVKCGEWTC